MLLVFGLPSFWKSSLYKQQGTFLYNKNIKKSKIYFGWWTVLVTGLLSGAGHGFYGSGVSVFFKDIAADFGASRALVSFAAGIGRLEGGITSPVTGWLSDKYGPKWVIFTGVCLAGTGMILMNFVANVWQYVLIWGLFIGVGLNIGLTIAVDKALNDWFVVKRGLAQGTKFGLIGVGTVIVLPIVTYLVTTVGWRMTCFIWGCLMLASAPLTLIFIKNRQPEHYGLLPDGAEPEAEPKETLLNLNPGNIDFDYENQETEFTFRQAIKTKAYWLMAVALGVQMFVVGGINIHLIPLLTDAGVSRARAAGMMMVMVFFTIPSRFFGGVLSDFVGKKYQNLLLAGGFMIQALGLAIFLLGRDSTIAIYSFLVLYGFASGATTPIFILTLGRYYGRQAFGSIFGSSMAIRAPISLIAPVFSGWVFDITASYTIAFAVFIVFAIIAAVLMCLVRPVKPADQPGPA